MTQLTIDFSAPLAQPHSATSLAAAESITPGRGERLTLEFLQACGEHGATDPEIQEHFGWDGSYQRPRRINLCHRGLVKDSGSTRSTKSGRASVVWIASEYRSLPTPTGDERD